MTRKIYEVKARIINTHRVKGSIYTLSFEAPEIAATALPLQFVNVTVGNSTDPLLRRPFSLSGIHEKKGIIEITWAVVGAGTKMMSQWTVDRRVSVLGPLGNGLDPDHLPLHKGLLLVAGGTGAAPLLPLAQQVIKKGASVTFFNGARSAAELIDVSSLKDGCELHVATEDGSLGTKGFVTDPLRSYLARKACLSPNFKVTVVACGPKAMLSQVKQICGRYEFPLLVSLEERMACGYGLCQGCVVKSQGVEGKYYRVCTDGPVFWAGDVDLGECVQ